MNEENSKGIDMAEPRYTTEETRVHKGAFARSGHIFLVIKHKSKFTSYRNHVAIPFGLTAEQKKEVAEALWVQLTTKYALS